MIWALCGTTVGASEEAASIAVPSGQPIAFHEAFLDDAVMGLTARYRFVAQDLAVSVDNLSYAELEADLAHLCAEVALPGLAQIDPAPSLIVITLSAEATEFGAPTPDVVEVFEAYRFEDGNCVWEAF